MKKIILFSFTIMKLERMEPTWTQANIQKSPIDKPE